MLIQDWAAQKKVGLWWLAELIAEIMIILKKNYPYLNSMMEWRSTAESREMGGVKKGGGCHFLDLDSFAADFCKL